MNKYKNWGACYEKSNIMWFAATYANIFGIAAYYDGSAVRGAERARPGQL